MPTEVLPQTVLVDRTTARNRSRPLRKLAVATPRRLVRSAASCLQPEAVWRWKITRAPRWFFQVG